MRQKEEEMSANKTNLEYKEHHNISRLSSIHIPGTWTIKPKPNLYDSTMNSSSQYLLSSTQRRML